MSEDRILESLPSVEIAVTAIDKRTYEFQISPAGTTKVLEGNFLPCQTIVDVPVGAVSADSFFRLRLVEYTEGDLSSFSVQQEDGQEYYWPRPTDIFYEVSADTDLSAPVTVELDLESILTPSELSRAEVRYYSSGAWQKINSTVSGSILSFQVLQPGTYGVFVNEFAYSRFTKYMASLLPSWMEIRKNPASIGQQFLNHFGLEFEVIQDYLDWCLNNQFIGTANVGQIDIIYKADLPPGVTSNHQITVYDDQQPIQLVDTVEAFYRANNHVAIIDFERRIVYTRFFYENGIDIKAVDGAEVIEAKNIPLEIHHVWNSFDEFGLLLGLKRLYGERNAEFKERILDVFRYPANSTRLGLYHAVARELGLIRRITWEDDKVPLTIQAENLLPETILVDGQKVNVEINSDGSVTIPPQNTGRARTVSFIAGFYLHALHDSDDEVLVSLLYEGDYHPTSYFRSLVERLHREIPIMWDEFKWDEGFWDVVNKDFLGLEFLPTVWDLDPSVWRIYDEV